jgi:hypothetical protein
MDPRRRLAKSHRVNHQGSCDYERVPDPHNSALVKLGLVLVPVYFILAFALWASWDLRSTPSIVTVAMFAAGIPVLISTDFSRVKAAAAGMHFEAKRNKRQSGSKPKRAGSLRLHLSDSDSGLRPGLAKFRPIGSTRPKARRGVRSHSKSAELDPILGQTSSQDFPL